MRSEGRVLEARALFVCPSRSHYGRDCSAMLKVLKDSVESKVS